MTLFRQTFIIISILFFIIFSGTFTITIYNTRNFLSAQMLAQAQDTANALGLSLSSTLEDNATKLSMVNALLGAGYYESIQLLDVNGKIIINRYQDMGKKWVPLWFKRLVNLPSPHADALILSGWVQKGTVRVTSSPTYAYRKLWKQSVALLNWFVLLFLLSVLACYWIIRYMFQPLKTIIHQAQAICNHEFIIQEKLPSTREFQLVTVAINKMTEKVKSLLDEQYELSDRLKKLAYQDSLTGLGNRRFFTMQLQSVLNKKTLLGGLLLLEISGLKNYNDQYGYKKGDEVIKSIADVVANESLDIKEVFLARIAGGTFLLLAPNFSPDELENLAAGIMCVITETIQNSQETKALLTANLGIANLEGDTSDALLSKADHALREAQSKGPFEFHYYHDKAGEIIRTASEWREFIEKIIREDLITVHYQPVLTCPDKKIIHYEALMRVPEENNTLLTASVILPMAERYNLKHKLDQCVVKAVLKRIKSTTDGNFFAINLSHTTISDENALDWLLTTVKQSGVGEKIIFEITEYVALTHLSLIKNFLLPRIESIGVSLALDHFGCGFSGFDYLQNLRLKHIKIDASFIQSLSEDNTRTYIGALIKIAHTLDIHVIAEAVENKEQWENLLSLHFDGAQGQYLFAPVKMD